MDKIRAFLRSDIGKILLPLVAMGIFALERRYPQAQDVIAGVLLWAAKNNIGHPPCDAPPTKEVL